jgi:peptidoglycan/xylan/chitin deacetylase (PgdA/CDA1 family)
MWPHRSADRRGGQNSDLGLSFDPDELESNLVWIWTSARSGSTWLLRLLSHPLKIEDSRRDPEDYLGFHAPRTWQGKVDLIPVDTTFLANHLVPVSGATGYTKDGMPASFSAALGLGNRANYFFSNKYADAWRPELRRMILVRFNRMIERTAERYPIADPLMVIKEVAGAQAAHLIMSLFPRSKMIFLVRDGRDVVDSQTAANQPGGWLPVNAWETHEERAAFVRDRSNAWVGDVTMIRRAFEAHPPNLRRRVRYEDVLADPSGTIAQLHRWIGRERGERWLERTVEVNSFDNVPAQHKGSTKFYRSAKPGAWRENLSDPEQLIMNEVMGEKLAEFGYSTDGQSAGADETGDGDDSRARSLGPSGMGRSFGDRIKAASSGRDFSGVSRLVVKRGGLASRRDRKIALTFDDGPVVKTRDALVALERHNARGTFFLVGRKLPGHGDLVRRMVAAGHEIGNHSFGHDLFPSTEDIEANSVLLERITGVRPHLFRPPFGAIDRPAAEAAEQAGMRPILWSADSNDAVPVWSGASVQQILTDVMSAIAPGAIVLLHDGLVWSRAVEALPALLVALSGAGYEMVTVSELLDPSESRGARGAVGGRIRRLVSRDLQSSGRPRVPFKEADAERGAAMAALIADLDEAADHDLGAPLEHSVGERLRASAGEFLSSAAAANSLLASETGASFESNAFYVVVLGYAVRVAERELGAKPLPSELSKRLEDEPDVEAGVAVARTLAFPDGFGAAAGSRRHGGSQDEIEAFTETDGLREPTAQFRELFGPGPEAWDQLEKWAGEVGSDAARTRMRSMLDAAGVDPGFDTEPQVKRVAYDYTFRLGYALAACDEHRNLTRA